MRRNEEFINRKKYQENVVYRWENMDKIVQK